MDDKKIRLEKFLKELSALSKKHGFHIGGCGCCGSPWVDDADGNEIARDLGFNETKFEYSADYQL